MADDDSGHTICTLQTIGWLSFFKFIAYLFYLDSNFNQTESCIESESRLANGWRFDVGLRHSNILRCNLKKIILEDRNHAKVNTLSILQ